ncbi:zinc finger CCCH domain-containing protein 12 isoform X1 [Amborella trichopoda]|uniref:zinc finger CCCH domain-containing protein 12 isoform X1 n=1 Tax=Amborella trichopoda TaxID=13333 RepID=UPI0005D3CBB7|nr:zinc finger CCCH domain-containing protein 12 isoform X1 [Amborella trichopoda]|eukprot:XP_011622812.1 zinc finger CCCH domain-containing protein 12 isoform X1 [Amborella trichopoda]
MNPPSELWPPFSRNHPIMWPTDEDFEPQNPNPNFHPSKKLRLSFSFGDPNPIDPFPSRPRGNPSYGRIFFKTKLCTRFQQGNCPYTPNSCNYAHGVDDLRKPPPNWQQIVDSGASSAPLPLFPFREEPTLPLPTPPQLLTWQENQRLHRLRICKKYYNGEVCSYGDRCNFVHDDLGRSRESLAISIGTNSNSGNGGSHVFESLSNFSKKPVGLNATEGGNGGELNGSNLKPMFWKTRMCNKWESTGSCPFGEKCHFAHGAAAELQKYGVVMDTDIENSGLTPTSKPSHPSTGVKNTSTLRRSCELGQGQRGLSKWKGPEKINRIYADWIDDNEWEHTARAQVAEKA